VANSPPVWKDLPALRKKPLRPPFFRGGFCCLAAIFNSGVCLCVQCMCVLIWGVFCWEGRDECGVVSSGYGGVVGMRNVRQSLSDLS